MKIYNPSLLILSRTTGSLYVSSSLTSSYLKLSSIPTTVSNTYVLTVDSGGNVSKQLGGKVYLDTNISLVHVGNKAYTGNVQNWLSNWRSQFASEQQVIQSKSALLTKYFTPPTFVEDNKIDDEMFKIL